MTLAIAWQRKLRGVDELILATDSRITGGLVWDAGPKLFGLVRGDAAIAFAGSTLYAYPLVQQLRLSLDTFQKTRTRAQDITDLPNHILHVLNAVTDDAVLHDLVRAKAEELDVQILLAGYSWKVGKFKLWRFQFDRAQGTFVKSSPVSTRRRTIMFAGDGASVARYRVDALLRSRGRRLGLDMEPFEVLCDMSIEPGFNTIGGPPQILKVYKHGNTLPMCVYWPRGAAEKVLTFAGRALLEYEQVVYRRIDPDNLEVTDGTTYHPK